MKGEPVTVAALFAEEDGAYFGLPGVDPWDEKRDARLYAGPWPVVAHPPCARWSMLARLNEVRYGLKVGDDGGTFVAALAAVRKWGGVLEHPASSIAWNRFGLQRPRAGGWQQDGVTGDFVTEVFQRNYGHRANKKTWLLASGSQPPDLNWAAPPPPEAWVSTDRPCKVMTVELMGKKERIRTPPAFRAALLDIARRSR